MTDAPPVVPLPYSPSDLQRRLGETWPARLADAYRWMRLGRALDSRMLALQRQGRIGFYGPATGQEAVSVGVGLALRPHDWVFPGLREQLLALVRGHSLVAYAHHLFADAEDPARGRQMPCHPTAREVRYVSMSSVVGTQVSQAVGLAYGLKLKREPAVSLAFFGDGATSANDFHAGMNFAAVFGLPVLFCLTNNQWAISVPVDRQTAVAELFRKADAYGMPGARVEATDVVAVLDEVGRRLEAIRRGQGPALLEFIVYRMTPHSSSDDPKRYQPADWMERALAHDPVRRLELLLARHGVLGPGDLERIGQEVDREVHAAIEVAERAPAPDPSTIESDVFADRPTAAPAFGPA